MSLLPSWVRVVLRLAALLAIPVASARSQNLQITGVTASQYWANSSPQGETDSRIRIGLSVQNTSGSSVVVAGSMETCGPFAFSDGGCPGWANTPSIGAGQTGTVYLDFVGSESGGDANISVYVQSIYVGGYTATAIVHIVAGSWGYPVTATIVGSTYTPQVTPKGGTVSASAQSNYATASFSVQNTGSAAATFKLKPVCGAWTPICTVADTLVSLASGEVRAVQVGFRAGALGNTGVVKLIATSPPQPNGIVRVDTGSVTMTSVDAVAPTITFTPVGTVQSGEYSEYWTTDHYIWIYVDVCDYDGNVGAPSLSFNNNAIPYITLQTTTVAGCTTAKRASYNVTLQSIPGQEYANVATITVSDGVHTTTGTQLFRYDDSNDHRPVVTVVHPSITLQAGQTVADTFRVTNPGWHTASYSLSAWCRFDNNSYCAASSGVSSVTVAAGATASFPVTFPISAIAGNKTTVGPSITYAGVMSTHTWTDSMKATPALLQPPTVAITPVNGTTVTTGTVNLLVLWCDPDGGIATHTVVWQGQTLGDTYTPESRVGCVTAGRSTYNGIAINPWQQTVLATIVDSEGHSVSATSNITFNLPISNFTPLVTPKNAWHVFARSVAVSDTFTIKNTGGYNATYAISASCGSIGACTSNISSLTLAPAATGNVIVSYTSPNAPGAGDTVRLVARYTAPGGAAIADTGKKYAIVPTVEATPTVEAPTATTMAPFMMMCCFTFKVTNPGSAQVQMHIVTSATNGFSFQPASYSTDSILPIAPGATAFLYVPPKSPTASGVTGAYTVTASYVNTAGVTLSASATSYITTTAVASIAVAVTPHAMSVSRPAGVNSTQQFDITMTGDGSSAYSYSITCTGPAVSCGGNGTTGTLTSANRTASINVDYTTGPTTGLTGVMKLVAVSTSNLAVKDSGMVTVSTAVVDNVTVDTRNLNPRIHISRGGCLTIAAGDGAAYECGDLRIVHALPTTTTMNKARTPALIYTSAHARTRQVIAADVTIQPTIHPTSLHASLSVTGLPVPVERDTVWNSSWNDGITRRVAISFDAQALSLPTGAYHYEIEIQARDGTTTIGQGKDTATMIIVNRAASGSNSFGRGWWLDGLEQLVFAPTPNSNQILWIGGDGSGRLYTKVAGTSKWAVTPMVDGPDTLEQVTGGYKRWMQNKAYVQFDNAGKHVATVNRQGHATTFAYTDGLLSSVTLPVPAGGLSRSYVFAYSGMQLGTVTAPAVPGAPRVTTLDYVSGTDRMSAITDPDNLSIIFGTEASTGNITTRTDKRGFTTTFVYDEAGKLRQSSLAMQGIGADIVTTFCAAESRGAASCPRALNLSSVYTLLDGPRTDVGDTTKFYINRFGAPDTVVNALGHRTSIGRSATLPMLATSVTQPNGFTTLATYNTRGLIETQIAVAPFGAADAITRYFWRDTLPDLDSLQAPTGEKTRFGYFANGDRQWQADGRGDSTKVWFTYNARRQLEYIQPPGNTSAQRQRLEYDASLGNLFRTTSPLGIVNTQHADAIGRVDTVSSPIGESLYRTQAFSFDAMDRVLIQKDIGPAVAYSLPSNVAPSTAPAVTLVVTTTYDNEGNQLSVLRHSEPNLALGGDPNTSWTYDGAGRKKTEAGTSGTLSWVYDAAGNPTIATTKRGFGLVTAYDAMNRPRFRLTPQAARPAQEGAKPDQAVNCEKTPWFPYFAPGFELTWNPGGTCTISAQPPTLVIGNDSAAFAYDLAGNMIAADNATARISREFFPGGALKTEIERVVVLDTAAVTLADWFNAHRYRMDFTYDLSGRRLTRRDSIPSCLGCVQSQTYSPYDGALASTSDAGAGVSGATFGFTYDAAGRLRRRLVNGALSTAQDYDADSRMDNRTVYSNTGAVVYGDILTYDPAGRIIGTAITSSLAGIGDNTTQIYNGLGALAAISRTRGGDLADEYRTDAMGNRYQERRWIDGVVSTRNSQFGLETLGTVGQVATWHQGETIPPPSLQSVDTTHSVFLNGNLDLTFRHVMALDPGGSQGAPHWTVGLLGREWTWNAYGADDRLKVSQRSYIDATGLRTVFSEYGYDALGRRVLSRSRWDSGCIQPRPACVSVVERTVWDGDQIVMELRTGGWNDAEYAAGDFYGTVRYTHAGGIDEPLALWKLDVGGIIPHMSWRGTYEAGSPIGSATNVSWPARGRDVFYASDTRVAPIEQSHWLGSLVDGKTEPSGLMYMRNRYYDPKTGRFTQEDPIGLAGGSNLFGFLGGDPVNFSDPFGLCPPGNTFCLFSGVFDMAIAKAKEVGQTLRDLTPVGDAQRSANAFAAGHPGEGAMYGAMAVVGVIPGGEGGVIGTKPAVRVALGKLGLSDDVVRGVRGLLGAGRGEEWGVQAMEGGGAMVNRFVKGGDGKSSAIYTYLLDKGGKVTGTLQRGFDEAGRLVHFDPKK